MNQHMCTFNRSWMPMLFVWTKSILRFMVYLIIQAYILIYKRNTSFFSVSLQCLRSFSTNLIINYIASKWNENVVWNFHCGKTTFDWNDFLNSITKKLTKVFIKLLENVYWEKKNTSEIAIWKRITEIACCCCCNK